MRKKIVICMLVLAAVSVAVIVGIALSNGNSQIMEGGMLI